MNLVKGLFVILFILMMIAGSAGMVEVFLFLFAACFLDIFILAAISSDDSRREKAIQERTMNTAPVRSFPAKIIRMYQKKEESFDYYITFEAPDGSQKELAVDENTYGVYNLGETGNLVYLHGFCFSFTREERPQPAVYPQDALFLPVKIIHKRKTASSRSCFITFETPEAEWKVRVSPYLFETCCEGETGDLICRNGTFLGFDPAVEEILDPALFERNIPQQDGNVQMPM